MFSQIVTMFSEVCGVYGIVSFSILGFIFVDKKIFTYCIYLMMLTMLYNTILKNIFQMPLPVTCPVQGFGFPSGHSHFESIFYIWIIAHYRNNILRAICMLMIICSWYTMVYLGFHYLLDVCAASVFALISVFIYKTFVTDSDDFYKISIFTIILAILLASETETLIKPPVAMIPVALLIIFYAFLTWFFVFKRETLEAKLRLILYIIFTIVVAHAVFFRVSMISLQPHIYIAFYFMLGWFFGRIFAKNEQSICVKNKILSILFIFCFYYCLKHIFSLFTLNCHALRQFIWFLFAFIIPGSIKLSNRLLNVCFKK